MGGGEDTLLECGRIDLVRRPLRFIGVIAEGRHHLVVLIQYYHGTRAQAGQAAVENLHTVIPGELGGVADGRLPASASQRRISVGGHAWRFGFLALVGSLASAGVAFVAA